MISAVKRKKTYEDYKALPEGVPCQPDIIFILQDNLSIIKDNRIDGAPDLVIEILSPSSAYYDLRHKKTIYEQTGIKEYWIVDPMERIIELFVNEKSEFHMKSRMIETGSLKSVLLPSFSIELDTLF